MHIANFPLAPEFAICKQFGMSDVSTNARLVAAGVSKSYASQIASGKRDPSLALAISIFRATGLKFGPISNASKAEIATLEKTIAKREAA